MNYFINRLQEEIEGLKNFQDSIDKLCELADKLEDIPNWKYPELLEWANHDTLFSNSYKEDTLPALKWNSADEYSMYHTFTNGKYYYNLQLVVGQGSEISFYKLKPNDVTDAIRSCASSINAVKSLAMNKLTVLERKFNELIQKDNANKAMKQEIKTKLDTVRLIKNLMDDFGLSFDTTSKNKITQWESEYKQ